MGEETIVFFRDDDVGEITDPLSAFFDVMLDAGVPCAYQVVPDYLDEKSALELRRLKSAHKDLLEFNQHGLHHEQILNGEPTYSEFAGGRSHADQLKDIREGRHFLLEHLGEAFSGDVFTPPCHKYDAQTLRALGDLGFTTLSAGVRVDWPSRAYYGVGRALSKIEWLGKRVSYHQRPTPDARVVEISCAIDVHMDEDDQGQRIEKSLDMLWEEFEVARTAGIAVGIMTHHQVCDTETRQAIYREFVSRLVAEPTVQITSLRRLADAARGRS